MAGLPPRSLLKKCAELTAEQLALCPDSRYGPMAM